MTRLTDVDRARALLDERDGELRANLRGDVAALALAFRRIRRESAREAAALAYFDEQTLRDLRLGRLDRVSRHDAERLASALEKIQSRADLSGGTASLGPPRCRSCGQNLVAGFHYATLTLPPARAALRDEESAP